VQPWSLIVKLNDVVLSFQAGLMKYRLTFLHLGEYLLHFKKIIFPNHKPPGSGKSTG
jgi:hypothetical protein